MKIAIFDPQLGIAIRVFKASKIDAKRNLTLDPRYFGCPARLLDGTIYETTMTLTSLPSLAQFDAEVGLLPPLSDSFA